MVQINSVEFKGKSLFLLLTMLIYFFTYQNIDCLFVVFITYMAGLLICKLIKCSPIELRAFNLIFIVSWFWASISAIYAVFFNDEFQNTSDPSFFFEISSKTGKDIPFAQLREVINAPGAVFVWRAIYNFFSYIGVKIEPNIGISINILAISLTMVVALKIAKLIFGEDEVRLNRLITLFMLCGNMWLMAAVHMRDAFVLFLITSLMFFFISYLLQPSFKRLLILFGQCILFSFLLGTLRDEYIFLPSLMGVLCFSTIFLLKLNRVSALFWIFLGSFFLWFFMHSSFFSNAMDVLSADKVKYDELINEVESNNSLGLKFITNQPTPIRAVLGSLYMLIYPIPFWVGLGDLSIYHVLKSLNAIFMFFVLPLAFLGTGKIIFDKNMRNTVLVFIFLFFSLFTVSIALSSGETRHLMVFFVPFFLLCLVPELNDVVEYTRYKKMTLLLLFAIFILYLFWAAFKFM